VGHPQEHCYIYLNRYGSIEDTITTSLGLSIHWWGDKPLLTIKIRYFRHHVATATTLGGLRNAGYVPIMFCGPKRP
jgi:hypothetical protein